MRPNTGASGSQGTPARRSARQAGMSPTPPSPPPPPPAQEPTPSQLLMMLEEKHGLLMTQIFKEFGSHMQAQNTPRPSHSRLQDFQRTRPPVFSSATDPLEADDWLRTMNKKLEIARVEDQDKVPFATHYLEGPASIWWDNQRNMRGNQPALTWEEFQEVYRKAHIPASVIKIKQQEFLALTQGNLSIGKYLTKFNNLSRYAPEDVDTDKKKKDRFLPCLLSLLFDYVFGFCYLIGCCCFRCR